MKVQRLRGRAGQAQRLRRLRRTNGLCEMCLALGHVTEATIVDHIVPLEQGGSDEDENTRNLCRVHDLEVTAEQFDLHRGAGLGGCNADGQPLDPNHPWNRPATVETPGAGRKSGRSGPDTA